MKQPKINFRQEMEMEAKKLLTRRHFFRECGVGLGTIALHALFNGIALIAAVTV